MNFRFTTGDAVNGKFIITSVTNANVFTITAKAALTTGQIHTGNVSIDRGLRGTYDFNDTWDLDTATGLVNGMYDYMPVNPDDELEYTYDEGFWDVDSGGDVQPIAVEVFPNPYNT